MVVGRPALQLTCTLVGVPLELRWCRNSRGWSATSGGPALPVMCLLPCLLPLLSRSGVITRYLCWISAAQRLSPSSVADLLEAALQVGDSQAFGYICEELPGVLQLQGAHMMKLLLVSVSWAYGAKHNRQQCVCVRWLRCSLHSAHSGRQPCLRREGVVCCRACPGFATRTSAPACTLCAASGPIDM